ncbi:hypothetical protein BCR36DRAFT_580462 [Piromyces finnis]|uniref:DNA-directed DNA polymerase n=1 Tax=Piromyces finnis TaxID=1754191 RepID=A0A1Y1VLB5_9FUNG|nr:hypothetical protein BCR36DRAFT_580462 [Piromyces finnis]|eukprot:ORX57896.1 hypothetical protein BCR36DRAFT_580462 [Piromyces finnis]
MVQYYTEAELHNKENLLKKVSENENVINRPLSNYKSYDSKFLIQNRFYEQQYSGIYFCRLKKLFNNVKKACEEKWKSSIESKKIEYKSKILDIKQGKLCYVIGTVFLDMSEKPNILKDVSTTLNIDELEDTNEKYINGTKEYLIEDESGRMTLIGDKTNTMDIMTGTVIGVLGLENKHGEFELLDYCLPGFPERIPQKLPTAEVDSNEPKYIAFLSGLEIGNEAYDSLKTQLLFEYLTGELGCFADQVHASQIIRVIIAGNLITKYQRTKEEIKKARLYGHFECKSATDYQSYLQQLDMLLSTLSSSVPIDIMPGDNDPSNRSFPQQPLHSSIFKNTNLSDACYMATNPHLCDIDNLSILGTSGQNINDILRYTDIKVDEDDEEQEKDIKAEEDKMSVDENEKEMNDSVKEEPIDMAERTLKWQHLVPTAPDTLPSYPFKDNDPFVIESLPNVYFIGNQNKFAQRLIEGPNNAKTRIIMIPSFIKTHQLVLLNVHTLECFTIKF